MRIAFLGDIAFFGRCTSSEYFKEVSKLLTKYEYVVGNLETPFSVKKKTHGSKSAYICSDVESVQLLKQLNIHSVSLANNHMFDYGREGYETTKRVLQENGIDWFGAEGKDLCIQFNNNRLVFLGFCCYSSNPLNCVPYGQYGVNEYNLAFALEKAADYSDNGFLPILAVHSGVEHVNYPSIDTIKGAHMLADSVPLIYYGHHPHVIQGIEDKGESLIAYSLGNFCFDDVYSSVSKEPLISLSENNRYSCILSVTIEDSKVINWETIPIYIGKEKISVGNGTTSEMISTYTGAIQEMAVDEYNKMRNGLMNQYFDSRKKKRDIKWYLKRLRPRYFFILLNAYKNEMRYNNCISRYL